MYYPSFDFFYPFSYRELPNDNSNIGDNDTATKELDLVPVRIEEEIVETNAENGGNHTYDTTLDEWSSGDENAPPTEKRRSEQVSASTENESKRRKMNDSNPISSTVSHNFK